jgi:glutathione S-transferase
MAVKLHRCSLMFVKGPHPCWRVQKALDDAGVEFEVVKHPVRRSKRDDYVKLTGQKLYPAIELDDGTVIRRESAELVEMVKSGQIGRTAGAEPGAPPA